MEKNVELKVMRKDLKLAQEVKTECENEFKRIMLAECKKEFVSIITINKDHALEDENPKMYNLILFGLYYSPPFFSNFACFLLLFIPAWEELY